MSVDRQKVDDATEYLKNATDSSGLSIYQHVSNLVTLILEERPQHIVDIFDEVSRKLRDPDDFDPIERFEEIINVDSYDASDELKNPASSRSSRKVQEDTEFHVKSTIKTREYTETDTDWQKQSTIKTRSSGNPKSKTFVSNTGTDTDGRNEPVDRPKTQSGVSITGEVDRESADYSRLARLYQEGAKGLSFGEGALERADKLSSVKLSTSPGSQNADDWTTKKAINQSSMIETEETRLSGQSDRVKILEPRFSAGSNFPERQRGAGVVVGHSGSVLDEKSIQQAAKYPRVSFPTLYKKPSLDSLRQRRSSLWLVEQARLEQLMKFNELFVTKAEQEDPDEESRFGWLQNLSLHFHMLQQCGVSLSEWEISCLAISAESFFNTQKPESCRFWGKILGTEANYYILETYFAESPFEEETQSVGFAEETKVVSPTSKALDADRLSFGDHTSENLGTTIRTFDASEEIGSTIKTMERISQALRAESQKSSKVVRPEESGKGANTFTYFVCTDPTDSWTRLPAVSPLDIERARSCVKIFSGDLDRAVAGFKCERQLLRAQIARISASCTVCPVGFYNLDGQSGLLDEDGDEEGNMENVVPTVNPDYVPLSARELASGECWQHCSEYLLPQGRCSYRPPESMLEKDRSEDDSEAEDLSQIEDDDDERARNLGKMPELFASLDQDSPIEVGNDVPAWSFGRSSRWMPGAHCVLFARSNLWPGAVAVTKGREVCNVYVGFGLKYATDKAPTSIPVAHQVEFGAQELREQDDPNVEEEAAALRESAAALEAADATENDQDSLTGSDLRDELVFSDEGEDED